MMRMNCGSLLKRVRKMEYKIGNIDKEHSL